jgi:predicted TIM-barrel fold metal-dependent hydrolase
MNDHGAAIVVDHPDRFGLLASVPMGEPEGAIAEISRAMEELHADGFVIVTNYDGAYLGDPKFDPVFAELDRRSATVFLHPVQPAGYAEVACGRPGPVLEFPVDTARTVTDAVYVRLFQRYPNVRLILAHAGGALPILAARLAPVGTLSWVPNPAGVTGEDITSQLASLYYDTAIAATPHSMLPLLQTTTADHVLFGTDYPPAGLTAIEANIAALDATPALTDAELADLAATALRLFPNLHGRLSRTATFH